MRLRGARHAPDPKVAPWPVPRLFAHTPPAPPHTHVLPPRPPPPRPPPSPHTSITHRSRSRSHIPTRPLRDPSPTLSTRHCPHPSSSWSAPAFKAAVAQASEPDDPESTLPAKSDRLSSDTVSESRTSEQVPRLSSDSPCSGFSSSPSASPASPNPRLSLKSAPRLSLKNGRPSLRNVVNSVLGVQKMKDGMKGPQKMMRNLSRTVSAHASTRQLRRALEALHFSLHSAQLPPSASMPSVSPALACCPPPPVTLPPTCRPLHSIHHRRPTLHTTQGFDRFGERRKNGHRR